MKTLADIKKITVLGAGTMGPGIALTYAMGGFNVSVWTRREEKRVLAMETIRNALDTLVSENVVRVGDVDAILGRMTSTTDLAEALKDADFVQETIVENREAKEVMFQQVAELVSSDAIIASNTSALNIFEIVPEQLLPQTIICHWYAPAHVIPLVEVVKSEQAPQEYADIAVTMLKNCGKTAVLMKKFIKGYIANRLQQCLNQEVFYLLENGYCDAEAIDLACQASFVPRACVLGICKRIDFGGVDMTYNNFKNKSYAAPQWDHIPSTLVEKVEAGELGVKSGKGFYDYTEKNMQEVLKKRDKQLFEIFRVTKKFMDDPV